MTKKIKRDAESIKKFLSMGYKQRDIAKILKLKRQIVSYWANREIQHHQIRRKKLKNIYVSRIINWAKNKTTSTMSCRKISTMINSVLQKRNEVDKKNRTISISYRTISNYLKEYYGKPRKIRKAFYLSEEQMKKRVKFCEDMISQNIGYNQIMFTDESKISLSSYTNDWIRLEPGMKEKLKKGEKEPYALINRQMKKFEISIMISGGISFYGLSRLIFLEGTMNNFAYGQALLFFKEHMDNINKKNNIKLIFEQDGAPAYKSKSNMNLLDKLFGESGWFQNPPNSPDLAYPIEDLWAIIKPRVKRRSPQNIEQLKQFLLEEWNSIPLKLVQNLCRGYVNRLKKVIELGGRKLEPEHLYKNSKELYIWETPENLPPFRYVYNNKIIKKYKDSEIKYLNAQIKEKEALYNRKIRMSKKTKKKFKKSDLKYLSFSRALAIIEGPERLNNKKGEEVGEIKKKLELLKNMSLEKYIEFRENQLKEKLKEKKEVIENEEEIIIENRIKGIEKLRKAEHKLRYRLEDEDTCIED